MRTSAPAAFASSSVPFEPGTRIMSPKQVKITSSWARDPVVDITAGAGVVVGLLRRLTRLPEQIPGLIADLKDGMWTRGWCRGSRSSRPCR